MEAQDSRFVRALSQKTENRLLRVEEALSKELGKYSWSKFYEPLLYALQGGKRIRPLILMLSSAASGKEKVEDLLPAAVAVELLHTESIIHDDIIDEEVSRRDKMAFHIKYGYSVSILTADFAFGIILDIASRYADARVAKELSQAALLMCEGELRELSVDPGTDEISFDEYVSLVSNKTASLFQTSSKLGAIVGGGSEAQITALSNYGLEVGIAYQISDDLLDWEEDAKVTRALKSESEKELKSKMKAMVSVHVGRAREALESLRSSPAKTHLLELADFTVERLAGI